MHDQLTAYIPMLDDAGFADWIHQYGRGGNEALFDAGQNQYEGTTTWRLELITDYVMRHPEEHLERYDTILRKADVREEQIRTVDVSALDAVTTMALLVYANRNDHFSNGAFLGYIKDGCVRRWLGRLQEIDEAGH